MSLKRILKFFLGLLLTVLALAVTVIGLGAYFLYTPEPEAPHLSGAMVKGRRRHADLDLFHQPEGLGAGLLSGIGLIGLALLTSLRPTSRSSRPDRTARLVVEQ